MKCLVFCSFVTLVLLNSIHFSHQRSRHRKSSPPLSNDIGPAPEDKEALKDALFLLNVGKKSLGLNTEDTNLLLKLVENPNDKNKSEEIQTLVQDPSKSNPDAQDGKQYLSLSGENRNVHIDNFTNITPGPKEGLDNSSVVEDVFKMVMEQKDPDPREKVLHKITIIETSEAKPYHESLSPSLPYRGKGHVFWDEHGMSRHRQRRKRYNPFWDILRGRYSMNENGEWTVDKRDETADPSNREDADGLSPEKKLQYVRNFGKILNDYTVAGKDLGKNSSRGPEGDLEKSNHDGFEKLQTSAVPKSATKALPPWLNRSQRRPSWRENVRQEKEKIDFFKNDAGSSTVFIQTESVLNLSPSTQPSISSETKDYVTGGSEEQYFPVTVLVKLFMPRRHPRATAGPTQERSSSGVLQAVGSTCGALLCFVFIFQVYRKFVQWYPGLLGNRDPKCSPKERNRMKWPRGIGKILEVVVPDSRRELSPLKNLYDGMSYKTLMISDEEEEELMVADLEWQSEMGDWLTKDSKKTPDPQS